MGWLRLGRWKGGFSRFWTSCKVHDFELFGLDSQANVHECLLKEGEGVLEPGCVDRKRGRCSKKNTIIDICQSGDSM